MENTAPVFLQVFGPLGPTADPGSLGTGSGSNNGAGCTKNQPRIQITRPIIRSMSKTRHNARTRSTRVTRV